MTVTAVLSAAAVTMDLMECFKMPGKLTAVELLDRELLEIRCRLLDIAAALDRIDLADGADGIQSDPRLTKLREAARILADDGSDRAKRVQMVFSDAYDPAWLSAFSEIVQRRPRRGR